MKSERRFKVQGSRSRVEKPKEAKGKGPGFHRRAAESAEEDFFVCPGALSGQTKTLHRLRREEILALLFTAQLMVAIVSKQ